jgi:hypothetical protein
MTGMFKIVKGVASIDHWKVPKLDSKDQPHGMWGCKPGKEPNEGDQWKPQDILVYPPGVTPAADNDDWNTSTRRMDIPTRRSNVSTSACCGCEAVDGIVVLASWDEENSVAFVAVVNTPLS